MLCSYGAPVCRLGGFLDHAAYSGSQIGRPHLGGATDAGKERDRLHELFGSGSRPLEHPGCHAVLFCREPVEQMLAPYIGMTKLRGDRLGAAERPFCFGCEALCQAVSSFCMCAFVILDTSVAAYSITGNCG